MKIYAPVKDANGVWASVLFVNGVGETDDQNLINWFANHGYKIGGSEVVENSTATIQTEDILNHLVEEDVVHNYKPDFDTMTPNELRDWMRENGYASKIKNIRNKDKLLEILRG